MPGAADTAIGVDVGGTRIRAARIDRAGRVSGRVVEPVRASREAFAAQVLRLVGGLAGPDVRGVGIGIPGRVRGGSGAILSAGYLDIAGLDLPGLISEECGLPARVGNDAAMALVAEAAARPGGAEGLVLMLTVGTGIGGAALQGGAPWHGGGLAGQFGHLVVSGAGPPCRCGRAGCVEVLSSGPALGRLIAGAGLSGTTDAGALLSAASAGDAAAGAVLDAWAAPFRRAVESLVAALDPRLVVVGGGLGAEMVRALARLPAPAGWFGLPVEAARLGDEAGVIGAGLAALAPGARR